MSLIADALREAQREREQPKRRQEDTVRRILAGNGPHIGSGVWVNGPRPRIARSVTVAITLLGMVLLGAAGFVTHLIDSSDAISTSPSIVDRMSSRSPEVIGSMLSVQRVDSLVQSSLHTVRPATPPPQVAGPPPLAIANLGPPARSATPVESPTSAPSAESAESALTTTSRPPAVPPASGSPSRAGTTDPQSFRLVLAPPRPQAESLFQRGVEAQRERDFTSAVDLYRAALEQDPSNAEASNNLGISYQALGQLTSARDAFRQAVTLQPRYAAAWSNLGGILDVLGQTDDAQAALAEAIRRDPGSTGAKVNLSLLFQKQGLIADGERLLREALAIDAGMPEAHYALAQLLEKQGNVREAIDHYRLFLSTASGRFPKQEAAVHRRLQLLVEGPP